MIDRAIFFDQVRKLPFPGAISQTQVAGCNALLDEAERRRFDFRWTAYCLATAYHETAHTMLPIAEYGRGKGKAYGEPINGKVYYGRGYVQLTWIKNYEKMGALLKADLVGNPELAMDPKIAAQVMFEGMIRGSFTGKRLSDFFNDSITDFPNARKIINGLDRAEMIASYARQFHGALILANAPVPQPLPDVPAPIKPRPKPPDTTNGPVAGTIIAGTAGAAVAHKAGLTPLQVGLVALAVIALVIGGVVLWRRFKK
jgi:putative chitinase